MTDHRSDPLDPSALPRVPPAEQPASAVPPASPPEPITEPRSPGADWTSPPATMWSTREGATSTDMAPVETVSIVRSPRGGLRWGIAFLVVALVVAAASAAFFALSGSSSVSTVARWAPADSLVYAEARFDLPGDQHAKLGAFLSAFPGFADQSTLDSKLDEIYQRVVRSASSGSVDYTTSIKPWFGGQLAVVAPVIPTAGPPSNAARFALIATVTDPAKGSAWLAGLPGAAGTPATYAGVPLTVVTSAGHEYAFGVDGSILVAGDTDTVHAVIDTKGAGPLSSSTNFRNALGASGGDHLGFVFVDTGQLVAAMLKLSSGAGALGAAGCGQVAVQQAAAKYPAWLAIAFRAESDHLVADYAIPSPAVAPGAPNRVSSLALRLPATTIGSFEVHDLGKSIAAAFKAYQDDPACASILTQVTDALAKVGGLESFTSWLGDATIVVTRDGGALAGGIVVALSDATAVSNAEAKFASIKNGLLLAGVAGVNVNEADHGGVTITTIDAGALSSLLPASSSVPSGLADTHASISYAIHDGLAIVGIGGDAFVKAVLDTTAGSSLADQPRYRTALDRAGSANAGSIYVDLRSVIDAAESAVPADAKASFDANTKPYLDPLQAVAVSTQVGDIIHARFVITVAK